LKNRAGASALEARGSNEGFTIFVPAKRQSQAATAKCRESASLNMRVRPQ